MKPCELPGFMRGTCSGVGSADFLPGYEVLGQEVFGTAGKGRERKNETKYVRFEVANCQAPIHWLCLSANESLFSICNRSMQPSTN